MKKRYLFFIFLINYIFSYSQSIEIEGIINDAQTEKPIIFATIYLLGEKKGCYTNEKGEFSITFNKPEDSLLVSCVGYQTIKLKLFSGIKQPLLLTLNPVSYELQTVEVLPDRKKAKRFDVGFFGKKPKTTLHSFQAIGEQIAVLIPNTTNRKGVIETINFTTVKRWEKTKKYANSNMNIRLKLWAYDIYTKLPGKSLLTEDVIVHFDKVGTKGHRVNIASQNIEFPPEGIFVGIEFLGEPDRAPSLQFLVGPGIAFAKVSEDNKAYYNVFGQSVWLDRFVEFQRSEVPKFGLTLIEIE